MARTNYYTSIASGNDTTGNGTIGTPWATVQKALSTITRDATNGDQINVQDGGTDTLSAALDFSAYGTPTETTPLVIRGYTSTANDGGQGVISGGGSVAITTGAPVYTSFIDMHLTNTGTATAPFTLNVTGGYFIRCTIDTSTRNGTIAVAASAIGSRFSGFTGGASALALQGNSYFNTFSNVAGGCVSGLIAIGNVMDCSGGVNCYGFVGSDNNVVIHNTIYGSANTIGAIRGGSAAGHTRHNISNNLIVGFSGVGGIGVLTTDYAAFVGFNAFYNNTTNVSLTGEPLINLTAGDIALGADPFVNAAGGDFRLTETAITALKGQRFPETFPGLSSMVDLGVIGAWQTSPGEASGGGMGGIFGSIIK